MSAPLPQANAIEARLGQAAQLIARLERISVDSIWAHRSSGFRGSLLKWMEKAEGHLAAGTPLQPSDLESYNRLMDIGLSILTRAARETLGRRNLLR